MKLSIWHNSKCSTSQKALDFLIQQGYEIQIRDYIKSPPSIGELKEVLVKMRQTPEYILRKKDTIFKERFVGKKYTDTEWVRYMSENPTIIERPIIITEDRAYLGRPIDTFIENWWNDQ